MPTSNRSSYRDKTPFKSTIRIVAITAAAVALYSAQASATCPATYPKTMLGVTELSYYSSTDFAKARLVGQAHSRVISTVVSSKKTGNITTGTLKMVNDWGSSAIPAGGNVVVTGSFTFDHITCQGRMTGDNGDIWISNTTNDGKNVTSILQSWKNSTDQTPRTGISHSSPP